MPITRSFADGNKVVDWTEELLVLPNKHGTVQQLGLFQEEGVSTSVVQFEETTVGSAVLVDTVRGERGTVGTDRTSKIRAWSIPHFNHSDAILPGDVAERRAYGSPDTEDSLAAARVRKMQDILRVHAFTKELARCKLITTGDVYAPNGTVSLNYYTEFGVSRKEIDFDLDSSATMAISKGEEAIGYMEDNSAGAAFSGVVGLASPEFFEKLVTHQSTIQAYAYYRDGDQQPLRNRLGLVGTQRVFVFGGVTYIEVRGSIAGTRLIPANDCYFVPTGSDIFKTFYAPAQKFSLIGTRGEPAYVFEKQIDDDLYKLDSETNFLNAISRPQMVIRGYTG